MFKSQYLSFQFQHLIIIILLSTLFIQFSQADVGTASHYRPPFLRKCPLLCLNNSCILYRLLHQLYQLLDLNPTVLTTDATMVEDVRLKINVTVKYITNLLCFMERDKTATACFGGDASQFPSSNMFGSAGEGIWDNGAACGRLYEVRCISAAVPRTCIPGQTIQIKIVDRAQSSVSRPSSDDTSMVLSTTAFQIIANVSSSLINIEFQQV